MVNIIKLLRQCLESSKHSKALANIIFLALSIAYVISFL